MDDLSPSMRAKQYHELARSVLGLAAKLKNPEAAAVLRRVSKEYERLALFLEDPKENLQPPK